MDKNKQFTENKHPIGTVIEPKAGSHASLSDESFKTATLSNDFDVAVDPSAPVPPPPTDDKSDSNGDSSSDQSSGGPGWKEALKPYAQKRFVKIGLAVSALTLIIALGVAVGLYMLAKRPQLITDSSKLDQSTLYIDSATKSVGVDVTKNPNGLQVGATVTPVNQGVANIRMGLVNGTDPSLLFEDSKANSWQVLGVDGSLQFIQGTQTRAKLDSNALSLTNALNVGGPTNANGGLTAKGNTSLGEGASSLLTVQGTSVAIPNNLSFANNTFFINGSNGTVAVGAASSGGYKLLVAGSLKASSVLSDGQVLAAAGSAKSPSFGFTNNTNTGLYEPGLNVVGITAGGVQVVQVQQGSLITVAGANIEADGYLRAGRSGSSPYFQILRFTGTLDGSGGATISDGMSTGYARVLNIQAFYQGGGNVATPLNVDGVGGSTFSISGGTPGRAYRATMIYSQDNAGW